MNTIKEKGIIIKLIEKAGLTQLQERDLYLIADAIHALDNNKGLLSAFTEALHYVSIGISPALMQRISFISDKLKD